MTETTPTPSANPAVERCRQAYNAILQAELARGEMKFLAIEAAASAYRNAMPTISGYESIRDFIACTTCGILIGAIEEKRGAKLLYAAQVSLALVRSQSAGLPTVSSSSAERNVA